MRIFRKILLGIILISQSPAIADVKCTDLEKFKEGQNIDQFVNVEYLNCRYQTKMTPIEAAINIGNLAAVKALLSKKPELARTYCYESDNPNNKPSVLELNNILCIYKSDNIPVITQLLIDNGADINKKTTLNCHPSNMYIKDCTLLDQIRYRADKTINSDYKNCEKMLRIFEAAGAKSYKELYGGTRNVKTPEDKDNTPTTPGTITANVANKTLTYNGNAQSCKNVLNVSPSDAIVTYSASENGTYTSDITMTNAGTMQVWYKITKENYTTKTGHYDCIMNKANGSIDVKNGSTKLTKNSKITSTSLSDSKTLTVTCNENTNPNIRSRNTSIVEVTQQSNTVTLRPLSTGTTDIIVSCDATQNYNASELTFIYEIDDPSAHTITATVTDKILTYNGKAQSCANVSNVSPSDAKVTYSTKEKGTYKNDVTLTKVGSSTIYYKIEKSNYTTLKGSYTCTIKEKEKKEIIVDVKDWINKYDGKTHYCPVFVTEPKDDNTLKIKYRTKSSGKYDQTSSPAVKNVEDSKTVYYQVTATGYTTKTGKYECTITRIPGNTKIKDGNTEIKQNASINLEFPNPGTKNLTVICSEDAKPESVNIASTDIATATLNGKQLTLTGIAQGTTDITVKCPQVKNHEASEIKFTLQTISNVGKINVSGIVLENREPYAPIPYANIVPVNEQKKPLENFGTITNLNGEFTLKNVPVNTKIRITAVGYTEQFIDPQQNLKIYLEVGTDLPTVDIVAELHNGDSCCVKAIMDEEMYKKNNCGHILQGELYKRNNEWVCLAVRCEPGYFVNPNKECEAEHHNEGDACENLPQGIKSGKWHQRGPNDWICVPDDCWPEYYKLVGTGFDRQCKSDHKVGDKCNKNDKDVDKNIEEGFWNWDLNDHKWICKALKCVKPYELKNYKCVYPQTKPRQESPGPTVFEEIDSIFKKHKKIFDSSSVWKDDEGEFNTARLVSDSVAGVVLGTVGGVVTSSIIKKNQLKKGFEDLKCTIGGQNVASYGDQFNVDVKRNY